MKYVVYLVLILGVVLSTQARVEIQKFDTPQHEARYKKLINELRCLVCQNQNLADSNASLASTLRDETYRMINEGKSDEEILQFMVQRYGDFVLYRPPLKLQTILLWVGPFLLLLFALIVLFMVIRKHRVAQAVPTEDMSAARKLLETKDTDK